MPIQELTKREIDSYRQWLNELDQEAREPGGDLSTCDTQVWNYFNPSGVTGRQIYESFTNEELLDILIRTIDRPGNKPNYDQVYYIYKRYLRLRFQSLNNAKDRAKARVKQLREQEKWPPDWPTRVSTSKFVLRCEKAKYPLTDQELLELDAFCCRVRKTRRPPLESQLPQTVAKICKARHLSFQKSMKLMGIPALNQLSLRHMLKYWQKQWNAENGGTAPQVKGDNEA